MGREKAETCVIKVNFHISPWVTISTILIIKKNIFIECPKVYDPHVLLKLNKILSFHN